MNTARGGLLDYDAVVDALEYGHLGAAAFDVFDAEPLPAGSRLRTAPRVVLTPHLAGATRQTAERAARQSADAAAADWLAGWALTGVTGPRETPRTGAASCPGARRRPEPWFSGRGRRSLSW